MIQQKAWLIWPSNMLTWLLTPLNYSESWKICDANQEICLQNKRLPLQPTCFKTCNFCKGKMFFDLCLHFLQFHIRSEILKRKAAAGRIFGVAPCLWLPATSSNHLQPVGEYSFLPFDCRWLSRPYDWSPTKQSLLMEMSLLAQINPTCWQSKHKD